MIGVSDKSWLVDLLSNAPHDKPDPMQERAARKGHPIYSAYFGLGHQIKLHDKPGVFKVSSRYRAMYPAGAPLSFQLIERHSLPMLFYSPAWKMAEPHLREEFEAWHDLYGAAYTVDSQGRLYWSYEVVECKRVQTDLAPGKRISC